LELKFPASICVLGEWIKIKFVEHLEDTDGSKLHGVFCEEKAEIQIEKNKPEFMWRVLIHEVQHCLLRKAGWDEILGNDKEEGLCKLAENFSGIFSLNAHSKNIKWKHPRCKDQTAHHIRTRRNAHQKVRYAVKTGKLIRPSNCQDCSKKCKPQGHHHLGYDNPLEVVWLCQSCHNIRHQQGENHV